MIIFQGSILAILIIYLCYWLFLNIFQALSIMIIIIPIAILSANHALRLHYQRTTATAT